MKKYLFSLIFILSITGNSQADWRDDLENFIEENQEFVGAVFSEMGAGVKQIPFTVLDKIKDLPQVLDKKSKKTTLLTVVLTAVASGFLIASVK